MWWPAVRWDQAATMLTGINSKSTKDLNVGAKSIKLLEGNRDVTLSGFGIGDGFLDDTESTRKID